MSKRILAGIVVFNPENNLINLVDSLVQQNVEVFLYINKRNIISELILKTRKVNYFKSKTNNGISKAINYFIGEFNKVNYDYLFTFDQDSMIDNNYVKIMISNFDNVLKIHKNAVSIAPEMIDEKFSKEKIIKKNITNDKNSINYKEVNYSITSGSLFIKNSFLKVGTMNEKLFIDLVDKDWCERAKINECKLFRSNNAFLKHKIGNKYINIFGIKKSYHQLDLRVYYIIRNSIYLILFGKNRIKWKLRRSLKVIIQLFVYPLLSLSKIDTFLIILFAIKDALIKKMGKMSYIDH